METFLVYSADKSDFGRLLSYCGVRNIMMNFNKKSDTERKCRSIWSKQKGRVRLFMDSGAYTDWQKGDKLRFDKEANQKYLEDYAQWAIGFYEEFKDTFTEIFFVSFDRIPGVRGVEPTPDEIQEAEQVSLDNFKWLVAAGVPNVLPVIHQHERPELINFYENLMGPNALICVSPANDKQSDGRAVWLDEVFRLKLPHTRAHALGLFAEDLLTRYNWYSCDATSWFAVPMNGMAQVREFGKTHKIKLSTPGQTRYRDLQQLGLERAMSVYKRRDDMVVDSIRFYMDMEVRVNAHWAGMGQ